MEAEASFPALALRASSSTAELAAWLDLRGRPAGPITLRPEGPGAMVDAALLTRLEAAGLMAEAAPDAVAPVPSAAVADVLLAPGCVVEAAIWTPEQEGRTTIAFPGSPIGGGGVAIEREGGRVRLSAFVDDRAVIALIEPLLAVPPPTVATRFEARLGRAAATVLAALLDMTAEGGGGPRGARAFSAGYVGEWLGIWWGASARTGATGQIFASTFEPDPPGAEAIAAELDRFAAAGLVEREGVDRFRLTVDLVAASGILAAIGCGFDLHRLDVGADGTVRGRVVHVLVGAAGAVVFERLAGDRIGMLATGRIGVAGATASLLAGAIDADGATGEEAGVAAAPPPSAPARTEGRPHRFCSSCGTRLDPAWAFCGGCGAALR
ncbi:MAG: zinc ribbon domain-containing protein [Siculibacillus sp.]